MTTGAISRLTEGLCIGKGPYTPPRPLSKAWVWGMQGAADFWPPLSYHPTHHEFCGAPSNGSKEIKPQTAHHPGTVAINAKTPR